MTRVYPGESREKRVFLVPDTMSHMSLASQGDAPSLEEISKVWNFFSSEIGGIQHVDMILHMNHNHDINAAVILSYIIYDCRIML